MQKGRIHFDRAEKRSAGRKGRRKEEGRKEGRKDRKTAEETGFLFGLRFTLLVAPAAFLGPFQPACCPPPV